MLFQLIQCKILYCNTLTASSKIIPLELERMNLFAKDVNGIKIDIIPSKTIIKSYAALIIIKSKENKATSLMFKLQIFTSDYES